MTTKSAHRDIALWRYETPSRGYFGYHLRAANSAARDRLRERLATLPEAAPHLLRFGGQVEDTLPWERVDIPEAMITVGAPADPDHNPDHNGLAFGISPEQMQDLLNLLVTAAPSAEASVIIETPEGAAPLWVWWDA